MGVKNLWTLLSDVCENDIDISSLHGKTLAVDLSYWICVCCLKGNFYDI
jgi:hypothetical protein